MNSPLVSICLPNLNTRAFLAERVATIFDQTFQNWELLVSDNHSEDGSWEFFEEVARGDQRISIRQAPREGLYANWNNCLARATGEYVYVATSDDTMAPDCLQKLVSAMERHPDCDVAHCQLRVFNQDGSENEAMQRWWVESSVFARSSGELARRAHVRRAPFDGLLHLLGETVYVSITQLLIRRSFLEKAGLFSPRWGSIGDFNWDMRAGLLGNTVHVPDTWGGWRLHSSQATAGANLGSTDHAQKIDDMIRDAVSACEASLNPAVAAGLRSEWVDWAEDMRKYYADLRHRPSALTRRVYQAVQFFSGTKAARSEVVGRLFRKPKWPDVAVTEMRRWLESLGLGPMISPASPEAETQWSEPALAGQIGPRD